jgi:hypothetical protein
MNTLSGTERSRRSCAIKAANDFSTEYLKGSNIVTPDDFIEAKTVEFKRKNNVGSMVFDGSLTNEFYTQLKEYSSEDGSPLYIIDELMEAWTIAEKECEANC